jgi:hypothetical protein
MRNNLLLILLWILVHANKSLEILKNIIGKLNMTTQLYPETKFNEAADVEFAASKGWSVASRANHQILPIPK